MEGANATLLLVGLALGLALGAVTWRGRFFAEPAAPHLPAATPPPRAGADAVRPPPLPGGVSLQQRLRESRNRRLRADWWRSVGLRTRGTVGPWSLVGNVSNGARATYALHRRTADRRRNLHDYYVVDGNGVRVDLEVQRYLHSGDAVRVPQKGALGPFFVQLYQPTWAAVVEDLY